MAKCKKCGSRKVVFRTLPEFVDDLLGVSFPVVLVDAVKEKICAKCGSKLGHVIPNLEGLTATVAVFRVLHPLKLTGEEIRFLRKGLGWRAKTLAKRLAVTAEYVSRCENGHVPMGEVHERLLRAYVCIELLPKAPKIPIEVEQVTSLMDMKINPVRDVNRELCFYMGLFRHNEEQDQDHDHDHDEVRWQEHERIAAVG